MTDTLRELLKQRDAASHAIDAGTQMHEKMRHIFIDGNDARGDADIIQKITKNYCNSLTQIHKPKFRSQGFSVVNLSVAELTAW